MSVHDHPAVRFITRLSRTGVMTSLLMIWLTPAAAERITPDRETLGAIEQRYGDIARARIERWQHLIQSATDMNDLEKLQHVNSFFNQVRFINDIDHWGVEDYWATPVQLLTSNGGDCEDFSIAKYFTLREMGVPAEHLRLTYVKALRLNQAHMVLTYYQAPDADPLVLDNLVPEIQTSSSRDDLLPVYSFNADGLWLARERGDEQHLGRPERLSRWKEVVARIGTEHLLQASLHHTP